LEAVYLCYLDEVKNKLIRYSFNEKSKYVIQEGKKIYDNVKKKWNIYFKNDNPLNIELACGYGEHTTHFSTKNKGQNYIGIDIKGARIYKGAKILDESKSSNAVFLRTYIENIYDFFEVDTVSNILISFPDPRPKKRDIKKRLTNVMFLNKYYSLLKKNGQLTLKTDDKSLFEFTIEQLKKTKFKVISIHSNLHIGNLNNKFSEVKTKYEKKFIRKKLTIKLLTCAK
tara:strand:- start:10984 stop:11664 length:681 start_codon:yes stop_codon:yes gene_type:complete